jgi:DNA (cytosine-5)-methyltransferase 1
MRSHSLRFIDLFAGIGGTRLAFEKAGCKCVFSSELDKFAQITYQANFDELPAGDIKQIASRKIPAFDILVAGFPCQPFSLSGVSKKISMNQPHGFEDPARGTLFLEIKRILKAKKPKAFLLENVKHLRGHNRGKTFDYILQSLRDELGYTVYYKIIDAQNMVPQHRERIYIIGFKKSTQFEFPEYPDVNHTLQTILQDNIDPKYTLSDRLWQYLQQYAAKHRARGNGFGYGLANLNGITRTLSARYYKDGSEILVPQDLNNPRRLTPRECARLMGFPDSFIIPVSNTQSYRQFGNSVVVPVVEMLAISLVAAMDRGSKKNNTRKTNI